MDLPRGGFRRAALVSWALTGIGIAGVAGASALAYSDTVKPPLDEASVLVEDLGPNSAPQAPDVPSIIGDEASDSGHTAATLPITTATLPITTSTAPTATIPAPIALQPPPEAPVSRSPQPYSPTPEPTATLHPPAAAPTTKVQNGFPIRTSHSPAGGGSSTNKFTPHTVSRGS